METSSSPSNGLPEEHDSIDAIDTEKGPTSTETQAAAQTVEWDGPKDPENPQNWSTAKKAYHAAIPSLYCYTV